MELTYMGHSGMMIRGQKSLFLMDYYLDENGEGNTENHGVVGEHTLAFEGRLYVLISHSHRDHFNPVVLGYCEKRGDIVYIASPDVAPKVPKNFSGDITYLAPGELYEDEQVNIHAFGSTDLGISFYVEAFEDEGTKTFFHAGDLNDWHWKEEVPPEEALGYTQAYIKELEEMRRHLYQLDLLMFPLDPRLGKDCGDGLLRFLKLFEVPLFAPMHFGDAYGVQKDFLQTHALGETRMICWERRGQTERF